MKDFWNERFSGKEYVYGINPNKYLKSKLGVVEPGTALFVAEGEGRNAVFAARKGFDVTAVDWSEVALKKAKNLSMAAKVEIDFRQGDFGEMKFEEPFDLMVMIFAHFPADLKEKYYSKISENVKPGGYIIFECFSDKHLPYKEKYPQIGGPGDIEMLFSEEEVKRYFSDFEFIDYHYDESPLYEGNGHIGVGHTIKLLGKKIK